MDQILQEIWHRYVAGDITGIDREIIDILLRHGIRIRQWDGEIIQINLSIPTTDNKALVIGLRYIKQDNTYTEDHFLCLNDHITGQLVIKPYYRGRLEDVFLEYKGAHKRNIYVDPKNNIITQANTISHTLTNK